MRENVISSLLASPVGNRREFTSRDATCETPVPQPRLDRIKLSSLFVLENIQLLEDHADVVYEDAAWFQARTDKRKDKEKIEAFRRVHNALASVYSYHELVRTVVSGHGPDDMQVETNTLVPDNPDSCVCGYSQSLAVVYCLRVLIQHQEYRPIRINETMTDWYHLSFDRETFEEIAKSDEYMFNIRLEKYIQYVEHEEISCVYGYLLDYVTEFGQFHMDVLDWIDVE